jgi:biopolymer transport protein ExbB
LTAGCSCTQSARVCGWHGHYDRTLVPVNHVRCVNHRMRDVLHPVLGKGAFDKPRMGISKDKSTISQMLGMGLARPGAVRRCEDVEIAMEEGMMEIVP